MLQIAWPGWGVSEIMWGIADDSQSGGRASAGGEQIVTSPGAYWEATVTIPIGGEANRLLWDDFEARLQGRSGSVMLPADSKMPRPWPHAPVPTEKAYRIGVLGGVTRIIAHTGFAMTAVMASNVLDGAVSIPITTTNCGLIRAGHVLQIGTRRYRVFSVDSFTPAPVGEPPIDTYSLTIWPPLRANANAGDAVELVNPCCEMRLIDPKGARASWTHGLYATVQIQFEEALP